MNSRAIRISDGTSVTRGEGRTPSFFSKEQPTIINAETIAELIAYAEENDTDVRLCLHQDAAARHHDMIIAQLAMSYFPPHCHEGKGETWNVLHGEMAVFVFGDEGGLLDARRLSPDKDFLYRVGDSQYHMVISLTPVAVYHEGKPGPFLGPGDNRFAPWAPGREETVAANNYTNSLLSFLQG